MQVSQGCREQHVGQTLGETVYVLEETMGEIMAASLVNLGDVHSSMLPDYGSDLQYSA